WDRSPLKRTGPKLRATRPPAQGQGDDSPSPSGHIRGLMHVQALVRREPQALLGGESVEVEIGKLRITAGFVGHRQSFARGQDSESASAGGALSAERPCPDMPPPCFGSPVSVCNLLRLRLEPRK